MATKSVSTKTVLCFEDLVHHRESIENALNGEATVTFWNSADRSAWELSSDKDFERIEQTAPVAVIVDMKDEHTADLQAGMRIARKLRGSPKTASLRLIAISAYFPPTGGEQSLFDQVTKSGEFVRVLAKSPEGFAELRAFVENLTT